MVPNSYLQYFYYTVRKVEEQKKWPTSRVEQVIKNEKDLLRQYADPARTESPADLMKRGGVYQSTLATQLINSHFNGLRQIQMVNVRYAGAVKVYPSDRVLEFPARVDRSGSYPLPSDPLPASSFGLVSHFKRYELLTVEAAVHGNRDAIYQALLTHPLGTSADKVQDVLDDMLKMNRQWLPQFRP